jgi:hypothetical protein
VRLLVEGLATYNQDVVLVPRDMHCGDVATVGELLIGLKLNVDPSLLIDDVSLDRVQAL